MTEFYTPVLEGKAVLAGMHGIAKTFLVTEDTEESVSRWTKLNGITFDEVSLGERRVCITALRKQRKIDILFTGDPELASWAMSQGITSFMMCHPKYMLPDQRPPSRSWLEIIAEIDRQAGLPELVTE